MTDQTQRDDLKQRLRRVESGSPRGAFTTNWYRNPDGPEAADRIERLERALREISQPQYGIGFNGLRRIATAALKGQEG
jgi:hypothetical protein